MKLHFVLLLGALTLFLGSCQPPLKGLVRTMVDLEPTVESNRIILVSDAGKCYGKTFGESFMAHIKRLTGDNRQEITVMTYSQFIRSPYNDEEKKNSLFNTLFVFINAHNSFSTEYGVCSVTYLVEAKYLNQLPFLTQEIEISLRDQFFDSRAERGQELAETVYKELTMRNLL